MSGCHFYYKQQAFISSSHFSTSDSRLSDVSKCDTKCCLLSRYIVLIFRGSFINMIGIAGIYLSRALRQCDQMIRRNKTVFVTSYGVTLSSTPASEKSACESLFALYPKNFSSMKFPNPPLRDLSS